MSNSIAPGSSADVNVRVTALTTNPNVPVTYKTIILKKNLVNGVNTLTQEMMSATNTKYVIKYNYTLGENITMPVGCVLEFDGGSISNGTLTGQNTEILANSEKVFDITTNIAGTWKGVQWRPEWFGAVGDGVTDDTAAIQKLNGKDIILSAKTYLCTNLTFNAYTNIKGVHKYNSCLKQKDGSTGDFIRLVDWFAGTIDTLRIEGGESIIKDETVDQQGLLKVLNYTYTHDGRPIDDDSTDVSTYYSRLYNLIIRNTQYSGLVVIGDAKEDKGQQTTFNWIHHFYDLHIENCREYGIHDTATDNLWNNINIGHSGYANLYLSGSSEVFTTMKLDGKPGYMGDLVADRGTIREDRYKYANIILIGHGNILQGLDLQSSAYCMIKFNGCRNNIVKGNINNWALNLISGENQAFAPSLMFPVPSNWGDISGNDINLNMYQLNENVGKQCIGISSNVRPLIKNNNIQLNFNPINDADKNAFITYLRLLSEANIISSNCLIADIIKEKNLLDSKYPKVKIAYYDQYIKAVDISEWNTLQQGGKVALGVLLDLGDYRFIIAPKNTASSAIFQNPGDINCTPIYEIGGADRDFNGEQNSVNRLNCNSNTPTTDIFNVVKDFSVDATAEAAGIKWYVPAGGEMKKIQENMELINEALSYITNSQQLGSTEGLITSTAGYYCHYTVLSGQDRLYKDENTIARKARPISKFGASLCIPTIGESNKRPNDSYALYIGFEYFDVTLGKTIYWNGTSWVDATGATV